MKKLSKLLCLTMCVLCLTACGDKEASSTGGDGAELSAVEVYNKMLETIDDYKYVALYCATTDSSLETVSSAELYGDLEKNEYTSIYVDSDTETLYTVKLKQNVDDITAGTKYIASDYGWIESETDENDDYRSIFTTFFDFVSPDNLSMDLDYTNDVKSDAIDYSDYYILEESAQSEDKVYIYYSCVLVNKETFLPAFVNVQTYDKSKSSNEAIDAEDVDNLNNYTNILVSSKTYQLGYYDDLTTEAGKFYAEANAMPTEDNIITQEEYNELYWKANGESNE